MVASWATTSCSWARSSSPSGRGRPSRCGANPLLVVAISRNNALAWQNGSDSEPYGQWPPYNMADCGKGQFPGNGNGGVMSGGCLFNL